MKLLGWLLLLLIAAVAAVVWCCIVIKRDKAENEDPAPQQQPTKPSTPAFLDLSQQLRPVFCVRLFPGHPILRLTTPTKRIADSIHALSDPITHLAEGTATEDDCAILYSFIFELLDRNLDGIVIDREEIQRRVPVDGMVEILTKYMDFLAEEIARKN